MLLFTLDAKSQIGERRNEIRFGVTSGVNINSIDFDPTIKQGKLIGYTGGIAMKYTCEKYFNTVCALQVELNYALPMFANLGWGREEKGFMFYILAGPQVGYCFGDKSVKSSTWTLNPSGNPDRPNNMYAQYDLKIAHKLDYGITAGVGLELNTSKLGHFTLEGRYYYGLGDVFGNSKKDVFSRSANSSIVVKMGYYITVMKN